MLVLGIDTSTKVGGIGLYHTKNGLIGETNLALEQTHSERLMPMVDNLLKAASLVLGEIDGLAITLGPGSFTGTRIGVTTAKTLAQVLNKPIVGVSTLEVVAWNLAYTSGVICPIFDARNRRIYSARFVGGVGGLQRLSNDDGGTIDELIESLRLESEVIYLLGDGLSLYGDLIKTELGERVIIPPAGFWIPKGGFVAELGALALKRGEKEDLFSLSPNYLKPSEAEVNWQKKHGK